MAKKVKLQPAVHDRTCQGCGQTYLYPEKGSVSTRHLCADCAVLPAATVRVLRRLSRRITTLERTVKRLSKKSPPPST